MGMKNLIILSLVAIGLAQYVNAFFYPGKPSKDNSNSPSFSWNRIGSIIDSDPPTAERPRREADKVPDEKPKHFVLGSLKQVKNGNFPRYGMQRKAEQGNSEIHPGVNSNPPQNKQENPLFTENTEQVLEKDQASSSESSSSEQSSESSTASVSSSSEENAAPAAEQQESKLNDDNSALSSSEEGSSSSEENVAAAADQGESSSSEDSNTASAVNQGESSSDVENSVPSANQEESSSSEENASPAVNEGEPSSSDPYNIAAILSIDSSDSSENDPKSNEETVSAKVESKKQEAVKHSSLAKNNHKPLVFSGRDSVGQNLSRKKNAPVSRHPRDAGFSFADLKYTGIKQGPQGQIMRASTQKHWRERKK